MLFRLSHVVQAVTFSVTYEKIYQGLKENKQRLVLITKILNNSIVNITYFYPT